MTTATPRVLVLGGSTINGLGYDGEPFGHLVAQGLGDHELLDLTKTSQTCRDMLDQRPVVDRFDAQLTLMMIAGTESLMRPGHRLQNAIERFAPTTWHGVAGLEPRARYSSSRRRRLRQRVESRLKVVVKNVLFRMMGGGRPRVEFTRMAKDVAALIRFVSEHSERVVLVGLPEVDPSLFPGTRGSFHRTNALVEVLADAYANTDFVSLEGSLEKWHDYLDDHFHLSAEGHGRVADLIVERIAS